MNFSKKTLHYESVHFYLLAYKTQSRTLNYSYTNMLLQGYAYFYLFITSFSVKDSCLLECETVYSGNGYQCFGGTCYLHLQGGSHLSCPETLVRVYQTTCHTTEDCSLNIRCHENLESHPSVSIHKGKILLLILNQLNCTVLGR
jgi:hypothetical protein